MKKPTQRELNPFPYSDTNKRYYTFDYYLRRRFGQKCAKISLDAGFTCPNIDGTAGVDGCIYCSGGSSGAVCGGSLHEQYTAGVQSIQSKWKCSAFIPYLQAHTNTYGSLERLREIYSTASSFDGAVMLAIATRADCLSEEVCELLYETSKKLPLIVELGLQTVNDSTANLINRGHTFAEFCDGYKRLRNTGGDIAICVHLINGLPGETTEVMLESARRTAALHPDMIKLHLLHVIHGTKLGNMYEKGEYTPMERSDYISTVVRQIKLMPPDTVIARVTGDGIANSLLAPMWSIKKTAVANDIDKLLFESKAFQGCQYNDNIF